MFVVRLNGRVFVVHLNGRVFVVHLNRRVFVVRLVGVCCFISECLFVWLGGCCLDG